MDEGDRATGVEELRRASTSLIAAATLGALFGGLFVGGFLLFLFLAGGLFFHRFGAVAAAEHERDGDAAREVLIDRPAGLPHVGRDRVHAEEVATELDPAPDLDVVGHAVAEERF